MKLTPPMIFGMVVAFFFATTLNGNGLAPRKAVITGQIENFEEYSQKKWIEISYPDILAEEYPRDLIEINADGSFKVELELVSPALCWGIYNKWFPFVVSPGDSLHLNIDANIWKDQSKGLLTKKRFFRISGTVKEDYDRIIDFQLWAGHNKKVYANSGGVINEATKTKSPQEFKTFIQAREKGILEQIRKFGEKEKAGELFYDILEAEIRNRTTENLLRYWWLNPRLNNKNCWDHVIPQNYFSFLDKYEMDIQDFHDNRRADIAREIQFLFSYQNLEEKETFIDIFENKGKARISDGYFKRQAQYLYSHTEGITRDLCLYHFAQFNLTKVPSQSFDIYASVSELIEDPYVRKGFKVQFKSKLEKIQRAQEIATPKEFSVSALDSIILENTGKVIFVDFWAPWCAPCMGEMPYAKELKERFKDKEVAFVYLANKCSENSWKATIAKHDIEGIHHLLSDEDYQVLSHRFDIKGIPHFLLFNKKGEVVFSKAPRPSDKRINSEIKKLLEE